MGRDGLADEDEARLALPHTPAGAAAEDAPEPERQSIGSYLRRQRKLRGISAEELARSTRIPLRSLERLEAGTFDGEVDGFVRGFVRTVAEALGLDPDDTVARMLAEPRVDESEPLHLSQRMPRAFLGLLVVVTLAVAVGLVRIVATAEPAAHSARPESEVIHRRDPVRALAESHAAAHPARRAATATAPPDGGDVAAAPPAAGVAPVPSD